MAYSGLWTNYPGMNQRHLIHIITAFPLGVSEKKKMYNEKLILVSELKSLK